eukprot:scaffold5.g824.t1
MELSLRRQSSDGGWPSGLPGRKRSRQEEEEGGSISLACGAAAAVTPLKLRRPSEQHEAAPEAARAPGFRGVSFHPRTKKWEAHIWRDGRQLFLGSWGAAEHAALAFDIGALRLAAERPYASAPDLNFKPSSFADHLPALAATPLEEVVAGLRKRSRGDRQQSSPFRGVTRHQKGRWEARRGSTTDSSAPGAAARRYQYLGLHDTEITAAIAYDRATLAAQASTCRSPHGPRRRRAIEEAQARGLLSPSAAAAVAGSPAPAPAAPPAAPPVLDSLLLQGWPLLLPEQLAAAGEGMAFECLSPEELEALLGPGPGNCGPPAGAAGACAEAADALVTPAPTHAAPAAASTPMDLCFPDLDLPAELLNCTSPSWSGPAPVGTPHAAHPLPASSVPAEGSSAAWACDCGGHCLLDQLLGLGEARVCSACAAGGPAPSSVSS